MFGVEAVAELELGPWNLELLLSFEL